MRRMGLRRLKHDVRDSRTRAPNSVLAAASPKVNQAKTLAIWKEVWAQVEEERKVSLGIILSCR